MCARFVRARGSVTEAHVAHDWERLTAANDDIDARLLVGVLEEAGIESRTVKDRSGYGDYLLGGSNPWAPVAVHVHASALGDARRILEELRPAQESEPRPVRPVRWYTVVAVAIVTMMLVLYVLEQRDLIL